ELLALDEPRLVRAERQRVEPERRPLRAGRRRLDGRDDDEVLDADPERAGLVVAGLVREHHPGLQRHLAAAGRDALRALVHREVATDAVPRAVGIVDAVRPQELPRERVELPALSALREAGARQRDVPAQHLRVATAHLGRGRTDADHAGDVRGAVEVLAAAVDEIEVAFGQWQRALGPHGVVRAGAARAERGDRAERRTAMVLV